MCENTGWHSLLRRKRMVNSRRTCTYISARSERIRICADANHAVSMAREHKTTYRFRKKRQFRHDYWIQCDCHPRAEARAAACCCAMAHAARVKDGKARNPLRRQSQPSLCRIQRLDGHGTSEPVSASVCATAGFLDRCTLPTTLPCPLSLPIPLPCRLRGKR